MMRFCATCLYDNIIPEFKGCCLLEEDRKYCLTKDPNSERPVLKYKYTLWISKIYNDFLSEEEMRL